mmetsp:Transcript_18727/g.52347  ORF Transcript_18727/g.52347 Transcript_18727/m.52347 type:complete len:215 (+) Transcript_18727:542-1186(+)
MGYMYSFHSHTFYPFLPLDCLGIPFRVQSRRELSSPSSLWEDWTRWVPQCRFWLPYTYQAPSWCCYHRWLFHFQWLWDPSFLARSTRAVNMLVPRLSFAESWSCYIPYLVTKKRLRFTAKQSTPTKIAYSVGKRPPNKNVCLTMQIAITRVWILYLNSKNTTTPQTVTAVMSILALGCPRKMLPFETKTFWCSFGRLSCCCRAFPVSCRRYTNK